MTCHLFSAKQSFEPILLSVPYGTYFRKILFEIKKKKNH